MTEASELTASSRSESSWTHNYLKAKVQADANCIALNHWASVSTEVLEHGKNIRPHDPDRYQQNLSTAGG